MIAIRKIVEADIPAPYSNHVLLQRTKNGTILASGASDTGAGVEWYAPPHFDSMDRATAAAIEWAEKHGVEVVYICENAN